MPDVSEHRVYVCMADTLLQSCEVQYAQITDGSPAPICRMKHRVAFVSDRLKALKATACLLCLGHISRGINDPGRPNVPRRHYCVQSPVPDAATCPIDPCAALSSGSDPAPDAPLMVSEAR